MRRFIHIFDSTIDFPVVKCYKTSFKDASGVSMSECTTDNLSRNINCPQTMLDSVKNKICQKIDSSATDLRSQIVKVRSDFKDWLEPLQQMSNPKRIPFERSSDQSDLITELRNLNSLNDCLTHLDAKCKDLESHSRTNNIHLLGLSEASKGPCPSEYVGQLPQEVLWLKDMPLLYRAHPTLCEKP